jgi:hypothetical protein
MARKLKIEEANAAKNVKKGGKKNGSTGDEVKVEGESGV